MIFSMLPALAECTFLFIQDFLQRVLNMMILFAATSEKLYVFKKFVLRFQQKEPNFYCVNLIAKLSNDLSQK